MCRNLFEVVLNFTLIWLTGSNYKFRNYESWTFAHFLKKQKIVLVKLALIGHNFLLNFGFVVSEQGAIYKFQRENVINIRKITKVFIRIQILLQKALNIPYIFGRYRSFHDSSGIAVILDVVASAKDIQKCIIMLMAIRVVEFSSGGYKIRKIFA